MSAQPELSNSEKFLSQSGVTIAYKEYSPQVLIESENVPLILLHGVTNAKETWEDIAQDISNSTSSKVYALDARNHGDSGWVDEMDYEVMAEDVVHFLDFKEIPKVTIVGHSMGGKTGMRFAFKCPDRLEFLIIEDISARTPASSRPGIGYYLKQLKDAPSRIPPNTELGEAKRLLASHLSGGESAAKKKLEESSVAPRIWDGRDLPLKRTSSGKFQWKTNLGIIMDGMGKWKPLSPVDFYDGPVFIIYGTRSPYKVLEDRSEFVKQFPNTSYQAIQDGGHMLHVEYPEIFTRLVCEFIAKQRDTSCMASTL